jgi:hypothetical protein
MGSLKPSTTYIYERVDNQIYAREMGQIKRQLVGWTDDTGLAMREYSSKINQVLQMCEHDPAMRELLDQLFVLYNLKKTHE